MTATITISNIGKIEDQMTPELCQKICEVAFDNLQNALDSIDHYGISYPFSDICELEQSGKLYLDTFVSEVIAELGQDLADTQVDDLFELISNDIQIDFDSKIEYDDQSDNGYSNVSRDFIYTVNEVSFGEGCKTSDEYEARIADQNLQVELDKAVELLTANGYVVGKAL